MIRNVSWRSLGGFAPRLHSYLYHRDGAGRLYARQRSGTTFAPTHAENESTMSFPYKRCRNAPYRETLTLHAAATINRADRTYTSYLDEKNRDKLLVQTSASTDISQRPDTDVTLPILSANPYTACATCGDPLTPPQNPKNIRQKAVMYIYEHLIIKYVTPRKRTTNTC